MASTSLSTQNELSVHLVVEDVPIYKQMGTNHWACFRHFPASKLEERLLHMDASALDSSP
jgi:hypothetical protein